MAIKLPDGRIMRTLPEQVDKNMQDIASLNNEVNVIKESITTAYKIQGSATVADLNANTPDAAMNGYVYNMTDAGSLINSDESTTSVQIGDNVVLVWNDGNYFWDRLSGVVDTSNLVTLDSEQTITGKKTFTDNVYFNDQMSIRGNQNDASILDFERYSSPIYSMSATSFYPTGTKSLGNSTAFWRNFYTTGNIYLGTEVDFIRSYNDNKIGIYIQNSEVIQFARYSIYVNNTIRGIIAPQTTNTADIGTDSLIYKTVFTNNISDGTNSVTVAEIIKKRLTVSYNVSAAASSGISLINLTLSAADLAKLDSTKPLIVANNSTSAAVLSAVYLPALNLLTVLAYQTQGNTSLDFDIYQ